MVSNVIKLSASCLKNWSAIALAIACTTAKAVLLPLYAELNDIAPHPIVPTLRRGNAVSDAPASRNAGALLDEFPRRSVGTRLILRLFSEYCLIYLKIYNEKKAAINWLVGNKSVR